MRKTIIKANKRHTAITKPNETTLVHRRCLSILFTSIIVCSILSFKLEILWGRSPACSILRALDGGGRGNSSMTPNSIFSSPAILNTNNRLNINRKSKLIYFRMQKLTNSLSQKISLKPNTLFWINAHTKPPFKTITTTNTSAPKFKKLKDKLSF